MTNTLAETYRQHAVDFLENLHKCGSSLNDKDIHQLRLSVKQMRAIFKLAGFFKEWPHRFKTDLADVYEVFEIAGRLREIQVNRKLLGTREDLDFLSYKMTLIDQEAQSKRELLELLANFSPNRHLQITDYFTAIIETIAEDKLLQETDRFIRQKERQIAVLRATSTGFENYHRIRKYLKQIGIVLNYAAQKPEFSRSPEYRSEFNKLEATIGTWHDTEVLKNSLMSFSKSTIDKKDQETANGLLNQLARENDERANQISRLLDELIPPCDETRNE